MLRTGLVAAAGLTAMLAWTSGGMAAQGPQCDQRSKVIGHLASKFSEAPVAIGVTSSGGLVEVLSTGNGETWTIIVSSPDGVACLIAAGEGWRSMQYDAKAADPRV